MRGLLFLLLIVSCSRNFGNKQELFTTDGDAIPVSVLKENSLVLIYSYGCGYSLESFKLFNDFRASNISKTNFIAFSEEPSSVVFSKYPEYKKAMSEELNWKKIENERDFYFSMIKNEVYPQLIYFRNGKIIYRIQGVPYDYELIKLSKLIDK